MKKVYKNLKNALQIPDSPPDYRTLSKDKVRFLLFPAKNHNIFASKKFLSAILSAIRIYCASGREAISASMRAALSRFICSVAWPRLVCTVFIMQ